MKRMVSIILILVFMLPAFTLESTHVITGYLFNEGYPRYAYFDVLRLDNSDVAAGEYVPVEGDHVGSTPVKLFSWKLWGNAYSYTNEDRWGYTSETASTIVVKYTISPLRNVESSEVLPFSYRFDSDFTRVNSIRLEGDGETEVGTESGTYNRKKYTKTIKLSDTITPTASSGTVVDSMDVEGSFGSNDTAEQSVTYKYRIDGTYKLTNRDIGKNNNANTVLKDFSYKYEWLRSGDILICIPEAGYDAAGTGTYRSTITVALSMEE
ncbi:MAG: hypothetical protein IJ831_09925 [Spirochaetales bacterium]|nr:hypothetical protein [Spirochaetales bacterium]